MIYGRLEHQKLSVTTYLIGTAAPIIVLSYQDIEELSRVAVKTHHRLYRTLVPSSVDVVAAVNLSKLRLLRWHGKVRDQLTEGFAVWLVTKQEWATYAWALSEKAPERNGRRLIYIHPHQLSHIELVEFVRSSGLTERLRGVEGIDHEIFTEKTTTSSPEKDRSPSSTLEALSPLQDLLARPSLSISGAQSGDEQGQQDDTSKASRAQRESEKQQQPMPTGYERSPFLRAYVNHFSKGTENGCEVSVAAAAAAAYDDDGALLDAIDAAGQAGLGRKNKVRGKQSPTHNPLYRSILSVAAKQAQSLVSADDALWMANRAIEAALQSADRSQPQRQRRRSPGHHHHDATLNAATETDQVTEDGQLSMEHESESEVPEMKDESTSTSSLLRSSALPSLQALDNHSASSPLPLQSLLLSVLPLSTAENEPTAVEIEVEEEPATASARDSLTLLRSRIMNRTNSGNNSGSGSGSGSGRKSSRRAARHLQGCSAGDDNILESVAADDAAAVQGSRDEGEGTGLSRESVNGCEETKANGPSTATSKLNDVLEDMNQSRNKEEAAVAVHVPGLVSLSMPRDATSSSPYLSPVSTPTSTSTPLHSPYRYRARSRSLESSLLPPRPPSSSSSPIGTPSSGHRKHRSYGSPSDPSGSGPGVGMRKVLSVELVRALEGDYESLVQVVDQEQQLSLSVDPEYDYLYPLEGDEIPTAIAAAIATAAASNGTTTGGSTNTATTNGTGISVNVIDALVGGEEEGEGVDMPSATTGPELNSSTQAAGTTASSQTETFHATDTMKQSSPPLATAIRSPLDKAAKLIADRRSATRIPGPIVKDLINASSNAQSVTSARPLIGRAVLLPPIESAGKAKLPALISADTSTTSAPIGMHQTTDVPFSAPGNASLASSPPATSSASQPTRAAAVVHNLTIDPSATTVQQPSSTPLSTSSTSAAEGFVPELMFSSSENSPKSASAKGSRNSSIHLFKSPNISPGTTVSKSKYSKEEALDRLRRNKSSLMIVSPTGAGANSSAEAPITSREKARRFSYTQALQSLGLTVNAADEEILNALIKQNSGAPENAQVTRDLNSPSAAFGQTVSYWKRLELERIRDRIREGIDENASIGSERRLPTSREFSFDDFDDVATATIETNDHGTAVPESKTQEIAVPESQSHENFCAGAVENKVSKFTKAAMAASALPQSSAPSAAGTAASMTRVPSTLELLFGQSSPPTTSSTNIFSYPIQPEVADTRQERYEKPGSKCAVNVRMIPLASPPSHSMLTVDDIDVASEESHESLIPEVREIPPESLPIIGRKDTPPLSSAGAWTRAAAAAAAAHAGCASEDAPSLRHQQLTKLGTTKYPTPKTLLPHTDLEGANTECSNTNNTGFTAAASAMPSPASTLVDSRNTSFQQDEQEHEEEVLGKANDGDAETSPRLVRVTYTPIMQRRPPVSPWTHTTKGAASASASSLSPVPLSMTSPLRGTLAKDALVYSSPRPPPPQLAHTAANTPTDTVTDTPSIRGDTPGKTEDDPLDTTEEDDTLAAAQVPLSVFLSTHERTPGDATPPLQTTVASPHSLVHTPTEEHIQDRFFGAGGASPVIGQSPIGSKRKKISPSIIAVVARAGEGDRDAVLRAAASVVNSVPDLMETAVGRDTAPVVSSNPASVPAAAAASTSTQSQVPPAPIAKFPRQVQSTTSSPTLTTKRRNSAPDNSTTPTPPTSINITTITPLPRTAGASLRAKTAWSHSPPAARPSRIEEYDRKASPSLMRGQPQSESSIGRRLLGNHVLAKGSGIRSADRSPPAAVSPLYSSPDSSPSVLEVTRTPILSSLLMPRPQASVLTRSRTSSKDSLDSVSSLSTLSSVLHRARGRSNGIRDTIAARAPPSRAWMPSDSTLELKAMKQRAATQRPLTESRMHEHSPGRDLAQVHGTVSSNSSLLDPEGASDGRAGRSAAEKIELLKMIVNRGIGSVQGSRRSSGAFSVEKLLNIEEGEKEGACADAGVEGMRGMRGPSHSPVGLSAEEVEHLFRHHDSIDDSDVHAPERSAGTITLEPGGNHEPTDNVKIKGAGATALAEEVVEGGIKQRFNKLDTSSEPEEVIAVAAAAAAAMIGSEKEAFISPTDHAADGRRPSTCVEKIDYVCSAAGDSIPPADNNDHCHDHDPDIFPVMADLEDVSVSSKQKTSAGIRSSTSKGNLEHFFNSAVHHQTGYEHLDVDPAKNALMDSEMSVGDTVPATNQSQWTDTEGEVASTQIEDEDDAATKTRVAIEDAMGSLGRQPLAVLVHNDEQMIDGESSAQIDRRYSYSSCDEMESASTPSQLPPPYFTASAEQQTINDDAPVSNVRVKDDTAIAAENIRSYQSVNSTEGASDADAIGEENWKEEEEEEEENLGLRGAFQEPQDDDSSMALSSSRPSASEPTGSCSHSMSNSLNILADLLPVSGRRPHPENDPVMTYNLSEVVSVRGISGGQREELVEADRNYLGAYRRGDQALNALDVAVNHHYLPPAYDNHYDAEALDASAHFDDASELTDDRLLDRYYGYYPYPYRDDGYLFDASSGTSERVVVPSDDEPMEPTRHQARLATRSAYVQELGVHHSQSVHAYSGANAEYLQFSRDLCEQSFSRGEQDSQQETEKERGRGSGSPFKLPSPRHRQSFGKISSVYTNTNPDHRGDVSDPRRVALDNAAAYPPMEVQQQQRQQQQQLQVIVPSRSAVQQGCTTSAPRALNIAASVKAAAEAKKLRSSIESKNSPNLIGNKGSTNNRGIVTPIRRSAPSTPRATQEGLQRLSRSTASTVAKRKTLAPNSFNNNNVPTKTSRERSITPKELKAAKAVREATVAALKVANNSSAHSPSAVQPHESVPISHRAQGAEPSAKRIQSKSGLENKSKSPIPLKVKSPPEVELPKHVAKRRPPSTGTPRSRLAALEALMESREVPSNAGKNAKASTESGSKDRNTKSLNDMVRRETVDAKNTLLSSLSSHPLLKRSVEPIVPSPPVHQPLTDSAAGNSSDGRKPLRTPATEHDRELSRARTPNLSPAEHNATSVPLDAVTGSGNKNNHEDVSMKTETPTRTLFGDEKFILVQSPSSASQPVQHNRRQPANSVPGDGGLKEEVAFERGNQDHEGGSLSAAETFFRPFMDLATRSRCRECLNTNGGSPANDRDDDRLFERPRANSAISAESVSSAVEDSRRDDELLLWSLFQVYGDYREREKVQSGRQGKSKGTAGLMCACNVDDLHGAFATHIRFSQVVQMFLDAQISVAAHSTNTPPSGRIKETQSPESPGALPTSPEMARLSKVLQKEFEDCYRRRVELFGDEQCTSRFSSPANPSSSARSSPDVRSSRSAACSPGSMATARKNTSPMLLMIELDAAAKRRSRGRAGMRHNESPETRYGMTVSPGIVGSPAKPLIMTWTTKISFCRFREVILALTAKQLKLSLSSPCIPQQHSSADHSLSPTTSCSYSKDLLSRLRQLMKLTSSKGNFVRLLQSSKVSYSGVLLPSQKKEKLSSLSQSLSPSTTSKDILQSVGASIYRSQAGILKNGSGVNDAKGIEAEKHLPPEVTAAQKILRRLWDFNTDQLRQLYKHYATTFEMPADGTPVRLRRGDVPPSPQASFDDCRRLLADFDVLPGVIDSQDALVAYRCAKLWEWKSIVGATIKKASPYSSPLRGNNPNLYAEEPAGTEYADTRRGSISTLGSSLLNNPGIRSRGLSSSLFLGYYGFVEFLVRVACNSSLQVQPNTRLSLSWSPSQTLHKHSDADDEVLVRVSEEIMLRVSAAPAAVEGLLLVMNASGGRAKVSVSSKTAAVVRNFVFTGS